MRGVFLLLPIVVFLSPASGSPITFQFTGAVTQVPIDDVYGDIAFGNLNQGSYTFNSAALDLIPADFETGSYTSAGLPYGMTLTVRSFRSLSFIC